MNTIDIAILPSNRSCALGCLSILISLNKKLFLNSDGVIHRALCEAEIKHECIDAIKSMSFKDFISPLSNSPKVIEKCGVHSYKYCVDSWKESLLLLEEQ